MTGSTYTPTTGGRGKSCQVARLLVDGFVCACLHGREGVGKAGAGSIPQCNPHLHVRKHISSGEWLSYSDGLLPGTHKKKMCCMCKGSNYCVHIGASLAPCDGGGSSPLHKFSAASREIDFGTARRLSRRPLISPPPHHHPALRAREHRQASGREVKGQNGGKSPLINQTHFVWRVDGFNFTPR